MGNWTSAAVISLVLVTACHHYGRATPASCQAKYIDDAWRPNRAKYEHCMASYERYVEAGGEEGRRERHAAGWRKVGQVALVAAYVHSARNGALYRCSRWSDGTVTCVPY